MTEIEQLINDLSIAALEANTKLAALAVVSEGGKLIIQTGNWDLSRETSTILNVIKGETSFTLAKLKFLVKSTTSDGIVATNNSGMGHVLFAPFQGGLLVAFAMPQADLSETLSFLKHSAMSLNGKV